MDRVTRRWLPTSRLHRHQLVRICGLGDLAGDTGRVGRDSSDAGRVLLLSVWLSRGLCGCWSEPINR